MDQPGVSRQILDQDRDLLPELSAEQVLTADQVALVELLAQSFDAYGGRDWQLLATGLGQDIRGIDKDLVCIRWDQVEYIDGLHTNMRGKLLAVFDLFISACWCAGIEIDLPVYIAWLLNNRRLYHYPYTSLSARIDYTYR